MTKSTIKKCVAILFVIYVIALIYVLFMDNRQRFGMFLIEITPFSKAHFEMFLNLIPFKTEIDYFKQLAEHSINTRTVIMNIGVNLILFLPMGMALPVLFENKFNKLWKVLFLVVAVVIICETIQFVTVRGSADIDDVILNTVGAAIGYGIVHLRSMKELLKSNNKGV